MLYHDGHDIVIINWCTKTISAVYNGTRLVWEAIRSCFGGGAWLTNKPWLYQEGWRRNKRVQK